MAKTYTLHKSVWTDWFIYTVFCICFCVMGTHTYEPKRPETRLGTCAPSEYSDQPAHSRSLIRIFTGRILYSQGSTVSSCRQWRLWSDCADAQTDLILRWAYMSEGTLSDVAVHILTGDCLVGDQLKLICSTICQVLRRHSIFHTDKQ